MHDLVEEGGEGDGAGGARKRIVFVLDVLGRRETCLFRDDAHVVLIVCKNEFKIDSNQKSHLFKQNQKTN